jgi:hypothetical protein
VSVPKTKPTEVSAESHIAAIANEEQRNDAQTLVALMRRVTKQEPRMWGPSIVGFGSYHGMHPTPLHATSHARCAGARVMPGVGRFVEFHRIRVFDNASV